MEYRIILPMVISFLLAIGTQEYIYRVMNPETTRMIMTTSTISMVSSIVVGIGSWIILTFAIQTVEEIRE